MMEPLFTSTPTTQLLSIFMEYYGNWSLFLDPRMLGVLLVLHGSKFGGTWTATHALVNLSLIKYPLVMRVLLV